MKLIISSHQYPIKTFGNQNEWMQNIENKIKHSKNKKAQLVLFPEYGSLDLLSLTLKNSSSSLNKTEQEILQEQLILIQQYSDLFRNHFSTMAKKYSLYLVAPTFPFCLDLTNKKYVNRCFVYNSAGNEEFQDKLIMTRFENEHWQISAGEKNLKIFNSEFGKWAIQICYDSEFPIMSLLLAQQGLDFLLAPSCTEAEAGATRVHVSCQARAIENQIYTIVSQTIGDCLWNPAVDKNFGYAGFYSPADYGFPSTGILALGEAQLETSTECELDLNKIRAIRSQGQVRNWKDHESVFKEVFLDTKKLFSTQILDF